MKHNLEIFDWSLTEEELTRLVSFHSAKGFSLA
ncbi:hypothetical protein CFP56_028025 [Quercus suber]|uniref:Uncharacterized protein n=1 Tax=Quercus suber TaxID=58331 RepID=A0AAW0JVJ4_QUESU